jgi:hypothetical protein
MRLYLVSYAQLDAARRPAFWWDEVGLTPLVLLPDHDRTLYQPGNEERVAAGVEAIHALLGERDWYAAFWSTNNHAHTSFVHWEDDAGWGTLRRNLLAFRYAAEKCRCAGLLADWEVYSATPQSNGGPMNPSKAWLNAERDLVGLRARQYEESLQGLTVGGYVATGDVPRLIGLRKWIRALNKPLVLDETYTGHSAPESVKRLGATCWPGFMSLSQLKRRKRGWIWDGGKLLRDSKR